MKTLIVYDSAYGNTEAIARAIAAGIGADAVLSRVSDFGSADLISQDLIVCGSPTQGGRPTAAVKQFLSRLPNLGNTRVAAFDTRIPAEDQGGPLKLVMGLIGYAAPRIEKALLSKGGHLAAPAVGFIVEGKEGPLRAGEAQRAESWGRELIRATTPTIPRAR